jgi:hypothetical protein
MVNQLATVIRVRAKYPTPLGGGHAQCLVDLAIATGAKLLRKDAGSHVTLPNGVNVSQDILIFAGYGIDVLSDAEGAAIPTWQEKGPIPGEYIDVGGFGDDDDGDEPGDGSDGTADLDTIRSKVAALELRVVRLEGRRFGLVVQPLE